MSATLIAAGCARGTATVTGTLVGADGACLYVDVPAANGSERYWLRHLPSGYDTRDERGLLTPAGRVIKMGDSLTVSAALSQAPFEQQCAGAQTLDASAIK
jgi:hypothetical protein